MDKIVPDIVEVGVLTGLVEVLITSKEGVYQKGTIN